MQRTASPRATRHRRVRARVRGTAARPRLAVFRSLRHVSCQLVNDVAARTLVSASDYELPKAKARTPLETGRAVGEAIAAKAKVAGVSQVVFDRGGYAYHGRVRALAEGARAGGLSF